MLKSLRNVNMIKSYRRKKALRGAKEMTLVNNSLLPFTSLLFLECVRKRSRETKRGKESDGRHDESEKLAVNIERVIRSLKNTWTIIKPTCQRRARKIGKMSRISEQDSRERKKNKKLSGRKEKKNGKNSRI